MKKVIIFIVLIILTALLQRSAYPEERDGLDPKTLFKKAKIHYESGLYEKALAKNKAILDSGFESGNLYYNIGNCYLKKKEIGRAILNYERARRIIPRDGALLANLRYARNRMKQRGPGRKDFFILQVLDRAFVYLTLWEAVVVFNIFYYGFAFLLILCLFTEKPRAGIKITAFLFLGALLVTALPVRNKIRDAKEGAVVTAPITDAGLEPVPEGASHFPLYAGMELNVLKATQDWYKVKRPDGKIGWVKKKDLELINN